MEKLIFYFIAIAIVNNLAFVNTLDSEQFGMQNFYSVALPI